MELTPTYNRIVVKVGTSLLTTPEGNVSPICITEIIKELCNLRQLGKEIILVTSGAIGAGMCKLELEHRPETIPLKQACAAVGQNHLMNIYERLFGEYRQTIAQVLLTHQEMANRKNYINTYNTLLTLLQYNTIPIINENDTVAVEEIKFGDNDTLSSLVARLVEADLLILLTDIDGLYSRTPDGKGFGELIPVVEDITPEIENMVLDTKNKFSIGGMVTKIKAAHMATMAGVTAVILNGKQKGIIGDVLAGKSYGTLFVARKDKQCCCYSYRSTQTGDNFINKEATLTNREQWILFRLKVSGEIIINDNAREFLFNQRRSLLPSDVVNVEGQFEEGDGVVVKSIHEDVPLAKGLINYSSDDLIKIKGKQSSQIKEILGYKYTEEIICRANLAVA